jgi:hypothetical protein
MSAMPEMEPQTIAGEFSNENTDFAPEDAITTKGSNPQLSWATFSTPNATLAYGSVEVGDLNNDGQLDIIAAYDGLGLRSWLGDGYGNWQVATSPATSGQYNDIQIGDVNNDGKPDVVGLKQGSVSVWRGDGSGNGWSSDVGPSAIGTYNAAHLKDVNLDGNLDIVAAASGTGIRKGVQVFLGNDNGTWSNGDTNLPTNVKFNGIISADFNNDGKPDIVAAGDAGIDAWTGNGAGSWTLSDSGLPSTGGFSDVELSDVDRDGDLDIVATGQNNNGMRIYTGNGAGIWTLSSSAMPLPYTGTYTAVDMADVNIDGYIDIMATSSNANLSVWTGDGALNWYLQNSGLPSGNSYSDLSSGDINNDGHPDLCIANSIAGIEIWRSAAQRNVNKWNGFPSPDTSVTVNDIELKDVNLDGKLDICYATQANGLQIWAGDGTGNWTSFPSPLTAGTAYSVSCADFNNDGKPDIIATQNNGIRAWSGNAAGSWTLSTVFSSGTWFGLAIADCNDDGKLDVIGGSGTNGGLYVWNGNGAGTWTRTFTLPLTGTYHEIETADLNQDGSVDIVVASGGLRVFLGNSNNAWAESSAGLPDSSQQYTSIRIEDLNDDGNMDILGASDAFGTNSWLGDGYGQWSESLAILSTYGGSLSAADFSIDGRIDVCVGSSSDSGLRAMQNASLGWKDVSTGLAASGDFKSIKFADINIDGLMDIVTYDNVGQISRIWTGDYEAPSFMIGPLSVGWNLISTPLLSENASLPGALLDLDGDTVWTCVKYYETADTADHWKSYSIGRPSSDLAEVNVMMGVWAFIPNIASLGDGFIRVQGATPSTTEISLVPGWNLVGYPSSMERVASATLPASVDMISVFQTEIPYISDISVLSTVTLEPGKAYWVHAIQDCMWALEY